MGIGILASELFMGIGIGIGIGILASELFMGTFHGNRHLASELSMGIGHRPSAIGIQFIFVHVP